MNRRSFIENSAPDLYLLRIVYHHLSKWQCSGQKWGWPAAYLEINKLPCLHEIDIPNCLNVYSIYRRKLGVIGFFVLLFLDV
jgi:hypothetical protein